MNTQNNFEFQIHDWNNYHEIDGEDEEKYVIQLFGRTMDDKDVCLKVTDFTPFFYVEIPQKWEQRQINRFVEVLKNKVKWRANNISGYDYDLSKSLIRYKLVRKYKFYKFTNKKLYNFIMLVFKSYTSMKEFSNVLRKPLQVLSDKPILYRKYESNIEPHIRFMHINNISSCGWVSIDKTKLKKENDYSYCDCSFSVRWSEVKPLKNDDQMAPFKIMGYDIECISCDHNFPQAVRKSDKIIQIGMTMYRYGSMNCYEQHILTLKNCNKIKGANVECYKTEKKLIRGWAKKIRELRPDFKAGYNIFGFDDKYIHDRIVRIDKENTEKTKENSTKKKFMDEILEILGKLNNKHLIEVEGLKNSLSHFKVKSLASAALGDNELKFFQVPGILSIDMMKVIQRDYRLSGYKLDNVSANFIAESAIKIIENEETNKDSMNVNIYTRSTKALEKNPYIQIMVDDGYSPSPLSENAKYKVFDIKKITEKKYNEKENKTETLVYDCIQTSINKKDMTELREIMMHSSKKIYWTFAKDDMHHTLINKYFKEGDPKKIKQIAKYCLKDCKLVNLLLAKLEIIVNNMGMAKVCHVPLSYLFLRGQGVKIFSLVSKKCKEKNFLIPIPENNKKTDIENEETYEGASVIPPKCGIYTSPISVLDFNSLYPNSEREKNLSHECLVNNSKFDNLPGYIYHDVYIISKDKKGIIIKNSDGTPQKKHYRFAQEIVSENQINIEMKDIFDKIDKELNERTEDIKNQKYLSDSDRLIIIQNNESCLTNKIKKYQNKISKKEMNKLIETEKIRIKKIIDQDLKIKAEKEKINAKIKKIHEKKISEEKKDLLIEVAKEESNLEIQKIIESIEMSDDDKDILIKYEKEKSRQRIINEKNKKYNTVNKITVKYGIIPEILTDLLNKRKETVNKIAQEKDPFVKTILNALQLAFKITANSLYGQTGAKTSPIYFLPIAACTTAIGRERLEFAIDTVVKHFKGSEIVYGDTDSIFIRFNIDKEKNQNMIDKEKNQNVIDKEKLIKSIKLAQQAAKIINENVPKPQMIVYEKTFQPFILIAKKKYVGHMYEKDPDKYTLKSMGIVLKRRDNAPIVKIVVGGIIDNILKNGDINKALTYTKVTVRKIMDGKYPIDKFIISKTLRSKYERPSAIAHKVLADRMAKRDPGNKPQINDRIPYVYIVKDFGKKKKKDILQGDLIEHPDYVIKNNLKIDYLYYLEHQIINPATQIFALSLSIKKIEKMFRKITIEEENKRKGRQNIEKWIDSSQIKKFKNKNVEHTFLMSKNDNFFVGRSKKYPCQDISKWIDSSQIKNSKININDMDEIKKKRNASVNKIKISHKNINRWFNGYSIDNVYDWEPTF